MALSGLELIEHVRTTAESARVSCFSALTREARIAACRAPATGKLQVASDEERHARGHLWTGALLYLILLEHVGSHLSDSPGSAPPEGSGNAFDSTLVMFGPSSLPAKERKALWVLRNSFAHDFSLAKLGARHHFLLGWTLDNMPAVTLPSTPWDGSYSNSTNPTQINLRAVEDIAEDVVSRIGYLAKAQPQTLYVVRGISEDEFDRRFRLDVFRRRSRSRRRVTSVPVTSPIVTGSGGRRRAGQ